MNTTTSAIAEKPVQCHVAKHALFCKIRIRTIWWPWNWGRGQSRSSEVAPFSSSGMTSYLTSIATMAVSCTISEIHQLVGQNHPIFSPPIFGTPIRGEAVRVKQRPLVTKRTRMMGLSGG